MGVMYQTLCHIHNRDKLLMLHRKRGLGKGFWNAAGGNIEEGESPHDGCIREVFEETGLLIKPRFRGVLVFPEIAGKDHALVYVFESTNFRGELKTRADEHHEARWVHKGEVFDLDLWGDDEHWLPILLNSDDYFSGVFYFKAGKLQKHRLHRLRRRAISD